MIGIFSKFAHAVPMTKKDSIQAIPAFKECFKKIGFPMSICSDDDRAFQAGVKEFFTMEGITHIVTLTHANVVERFIRTMRNMIHDRVRFNKGSWSAMMTKALNTTTPFIHPPR